MQRIAWLTCAFSRLKVVVPEVFRQNDSPTENCGQEEVAMLGVWARVEVNQCVVISEFTNFTTILASTGGGVKHAGILDFYRRCWLTW